MSGSPSEAEIQTQWKNAVDLLSDTQAYADGTVAGGGGLLDVLLQSLEGEFTPAGLSGAAQRFRQGLSSLIDPSRVNDFLTPILYEYARVVDKGGNYNDPRAIMRSLYEHLHANSATIKSRTITYGSPSYGGSNIGQGTLSRLTVDENDYDLEACNVEVKTLRCRQDRNTGAREHAEVFEIQGEAASQDALLRAASGSGDARARIRSHHAGTGDGGSLLRNSSFSSYSASNTPKFTGWTETAGGAFISQDTTNYYRSHPGATTNGSLKIDTIGSSTVTLTQPLSAMQATRLDPDVPYFLRVMINKTIGSATNGTFVLRMGSQESGDIAISTLGSGWQEVIIPLDASCWFRTFNEDPVSVEIEWAGASSTGFLLVDDAIFAPFEFFDGTYWMLRQSAATPVSWLVDDVITCTDTGGAPATAKLQWWLFVAGLGYLPSAGSPTITDP